MDEQYLRAIEVLRQGGVVALPTDTVFGLCAVASDAAAVERVYEIKARDPLQPMPLFVASIEQAELIADVNSAARTLAETFWPGALTIVVRCKPSYRSRALADGDTAGLRAPDDPALREMAAQLGPLTGTSANIAGREECDSADEVRAQLGDAVDFIVDAPLSAGGVPSTIVDCADAANLRIVRQGAITRDDIDRALVGFAKVAE